MSGGSITADWPSGTFLSGVDEAGRAALLRTGSLHRVKSKEVLLRQGEESSHVVLLLSGWYKVSAILPDGMETLLAIRTGGDLVGELAWLDRKPRSATVASSRGGTVRRIPADEFDRFLAAHPSSARYLMQSMADKLRWSTHRRQDLRGRSVKSRVARVVLDMAVSFGRRHGEVLVLNAALTQSDIAALAGTSQASAERVLKFLRERGILTTGYRTLEVLRVDALTALAVDDNNPSGSG